jgi:hypothetical protein
LIEQGRSEEAGRVYARALELLEERARIKNRDAPSMAATRLMLAQLRVRGGDYHGALAECDDAWKLLANARECLQLHIHLYAAQAEAEVRLGRVDEGSAIVTRLVGVLRSERIPSSEQPAAWNDLAELGFELCRAGQPDAGVAMIREAIVHLAGSPAEAQCCSMLDTATHRARQNPPTMLTRQSPEEMHPIAR